MEMRLRPGPMRSCRSIGGGVHDDARVEHAFGVEERLHLGEGAQDLGPVHLLQELRAGKTVAVLAGERAAAVHHEVGDPLGDAPHPRHPVRVGGVERRPDVQAPDAHVAVEAGPGAVLLHYLLEAPDKLLEPVRRHRCVLHEGDGLLLLRSAKQERQYGLAELDRRPASRPWCAAASRGGPDLTGHLFEPGEPLVQLLLRAAPLDEQDRLRAPWPPCTKRVEPV